jgi:preprotein translocase subunit YajC
MTPVTVTAALLDTAWPVVLGMGTPQQGSAGIVATLIPMALILGIFYFVMVLPMRKRQQKIQAFLQALKVGDRVVTSGGIYGSITRVNDQSVQLQIANNVRIEVSRAAIVGYQGQEPVSESNPS